MSGMTDCKAEFKEPKARKEGIAPQLKKVDIEKITATGGRSRNTDGIRTFS